MWKSLKMYLTWNWKFSLCENRERLLNNIIWFIWVRVKKWYLTMLWVILIYSSVKVILIVHFHSWQTLIKYEKYNWSQTLCYNLIQVEVKVQTNIEKNDKKLIFRYSIFACDTNTKFKTISEFLWIFFGQEKEQKWFSFLPLWDTLTRCGIIFLKVILRVNGFVFPPGLTLPTPALKLCEHLTLLTCTHALVSLTSFVFLATVYFLCKLCHMGFEYSDESVRGFFDLQRLYFKDSNTVTEI